MSITELCRVHRPKSFAEVIGQRKAVGLLEGKLKEGTLPHTVMIHGPTGVGKTTLARICARELGCTEGNLTETNCGHVRGIDSVREIDESMRYAALGGKARVWILDECQQLPTATQQALLKILEDTPPHVWFFLCTTTPESMIPTLRGRCYMVPCERLTRQDLSKLIYQIMVVVKEDTLRSDVTDAIITTADGSGRQVLMLLEGVLAAPEGTDLVDLARDGVQTPEKAEFIPRLLIARKGWPEVYKATEELEDKDVEGVRRQTLAYFAKVIGGKDHPLAFNIIQIMKEPFFNSGKAGLLAALYQVVGTYTYSTRR